MFFENGKAYVGHAGAKTAVVRQSIQLGYWRATIMTDAAIRDTDLTFPEHSVLGALAWAGFDAQAAKWMWMPDAEMFLIGPDDPPAKYGYIYFLYDPSQHLIKIGYSHNPRKRKQSFAATVLVAVYPGWHHTERELHEQFAQYHATKEWFHPSRRIRYFVHGECAVLLDKSEFASVWRRKGGAQIEESSDEDDEPGHG